jgi:crotonobetainyl-CoA:carnitine CoA-transferase CaiB-like acyl-CoA transferase
MESLDAEQVPCAPILPLSEVLRHPQVEAADLLFETDHPVAGRIRQARAAARFDATPTTLDRPAPTHGQHTQEILREIGIDRA